MGAVAELGVLGTGVMGAGVAAQAANAGISVVLLDRSPGGAVRSVETMLKAAPAPFMHPANANLIQAGDLEPDMALLADCDWIVEAIIERPYAKRALYKKLQAARKHGSVVSSNTSTIPLSALTDGLPPASSDFGVVRYASRCPHDPDRQN